LQHITVNNKLPLAQRRQVDAHAQTAANEPGDFLGASFGPALFPLCTLVSTARQHGVFGRQPTLLFISVTQPVGQAVSMGGAGINQGFI
jgi:hypothetical protein